MLPVRRPLAAPRPLPHAVHRAPFAAGALASLAALLLASPASATNPTLRHQEDRHGDIAVFGSTLGFDCGSGVPAPAGSTAACAGQLNIDDTAPDLYWRDSIANASITAVQARTSATLVIPAGATITYARLYWAALKDGASADTTATLDWLGGPQQVITADQSWVVPYGLPSHPTWNYYQASGDATDFISTWGAGDFRVTDVEALPLANITVDRAFSAWTIVVFYDSPGAKLKNLALFDGFTSIDPGQGTPSAEVTLSGFLIPQGFSANMTALAYEGDHTYPGDHFTLNGAKLSDAQNPVDDFFNSSRSALGQPVSGPQDVPMLSGVPGSMAGYDLDTVDATSHLKPGDTSCKVGADSSMDIFLLGGFATSVASLAPDFASMTKMAGDVNGGAVLPADVLLYTITATNDGTDSAAGTVLTDVIQPGLAFVPGSIEIVQGAGGKTGFFTDAAGDDNGDYDAATKKVSVRVGVGANASQGGTVGVGATVQVRFKVTVTAQLGTVLNQATLGASGLAGAPPKTWVSDGDPLTVGAQPTLTTIYECDSDSQCSGNKPHCDPTTHTCGGCTSDADCADPQNPACQPSGACGQCSKTNSSQCAGKTPVCDTAIGDCVLCTLGAMGDATQCKNDPKGPVCVGGPNNTVFCGCLMDSDCGGPMSGAVCDSITSTCEPGCRGMGGNGCPKGKVCSSKDNTIGMCGPPAESTSSGAGGAGGGMSGAGGSGGNAGGGGSGSELQGDKGRCACSVPGSDGGGDAGGLAAMLGLAGLAAGRRRRARKAGRR